VEPRTQRSEYHAAPHALTQRPRAPADSTAATARSYIIWIIFLVFVACYGCKRVSLSGRFVMGVTMSAILFVVSGYLASGFFDATRQTSLVFMLQYGVSSLSGSGGCSN
jgi:hypothetical protein